MTQKKILVVSHTSLFPKVMASQDRVFTLIKRLSKDHLVDVVTTYRNDHELTESRKHLEPICNKFFPLLAINPSHSHFKRKYHRLLSYYGYYVHGMPHLHYYSTHKEYTSAIAEIMRTTRYDVVQAEYWFMSKCLEATDNSVFKVIDTHDVLFDKLTQTLNQKFGDNLPYLAKRELDRYKQLENKQLEHADLLIAIARADLELFSKIHPAKSIILVPSGQDISYFNAHKAQPNTDTILFYGSMGGKENIDAFSRVWHKIFPLIKNKVPHARILVVGANPPDSILQLADDINLEVTGFVDDVRPYLSQAKVLLLPLSVAAGFRCRVVDVMAMGIPVVGNHRALDCVEMQNGAHGYIEDSDEDMATCVIDLLTNAKLRSQISDNCIQFATERYSIDKTFGYLSDFYSNLP